MDWIVTLNVIKEKLQSAGYAESVNRIVEAQMILGTPGEMFIEVMNELLDLKNRSVSQYELIAKEVNELLEYGKSLKYYNPKR